jgi:choline-sulfatase
VIYTSDYGDNLGTRGFWGKSNMYDESAGVPLIMRGPGVAAGRRVATPVSLVDVYPTIIETVGESLPPEDRVPNLQVAAGNLDIMGSSKQEFGTQIRRDELD